MKSLTLVLCGLVFIGSSGDAAAQTSEKKPAQKAQKEEPIDFNKARQLLRKQRGGGTLTAEEKAYLNRARAARRAAQANRRPQGNAPAPKSTLGLKPLTEMTADDRYKGEDGGLYGKGSNVPPQEHLDAALKIAKSIQPLDREGKPDPNGKIVLISNGMSNTTQEFQAFLQLANDDPKKSDRVTIVDGAQGGMEAFAWAMPDRDQRARQRDPWGVLMQRLDRAGVSPAQVQVAWIKQARRAPASVGEYPKHTEEFNRHVTTILQRLRKTFPNLKLAYLSSRIYAGNARTPLNPEPYAYEGGFAVRTLILKQIAGADELNYDSAKGSVRSPLLLWGPYLWGDGTTPRKADGLVWKPEDFAGDGTHPSGSGRQKVAKLLLDFFHTDPTARVWYLK